MRVWAKNWGKEVRGEVKGMGGMSRVI